MKIQSIILVAVLAVLADAEPQLQRNRKQRRRRAVRDSNLADITGDIPESTSERIKQRYLKGLPTSDQRNAAPKKHKTPKHLKTFVEDVEDEMPRTMSLSMSMSMSMQISRSYVDDMSMSMSMSMSM